MVGFLNWVLVDFELFVFALATLIVILHKFARPRMSLSEIIFRWFVLFPLGVVELYACLRHGIYSHTTAVNLGFLGGLYQYKITMANLGFGLIAILSFNASFGFRLAAVLGNTCWLWGDAYMRLTQYYFTFINAPSAFWLDVFLPVLLLLCLFSIKKQKRGY